MYRILILLPIVCWILKTTKEPANFVELRKRYQILMDYINNNPNVDPKFKPVGQPIQLTAWRNLSMLGYNVNKGAEIGICTDGSANDMMHILIHELAHSTLDKYKHNDEFWDNTTELTKLCEKIGIYNPIESTKIFCGKPIKDQ